MDKKLYVVIPCYNEEDVLRETASRLEKKLHDLMKSGYIGEGSRIVFIDDGSSDKTWEIIQDLHKDCPIFSGARLSRNFGQQNSLYAGLMSVKDQADIIVSMDADLQDDIDALDDMLKAYHEGSEIVFGVRSCRKKDAFIRRFASQCFYKVTKLMRIDIIPDHAHFRLMSQRTVQALSEYPEVNLFLPYLVMQLGFQTSVVYYERQKRFAGKTKYSLRKLFLMATDGITSFSTKPLDLINVFAGISLLTSIGGFAGVIIQGLKTGLLEPWLLIFSSVWAMGTLVLIALRIIGEYIGKTFQETKRRPRYSLCDNLLNEQSTEFVQKTRETQSE